ncbi:nucleotidyltransferase domain-containing protein [Cellulomonas dongxiuzhuiae]|uniref:Nucleotidyltransferase domain-containing protein n=1 Tax=Cellulomonas dongxiuzhuiae TaxID=2819979 RepID=A0ABX8GK94_9CELL|nr:nucleotidyltransferase domain-containing protein [Cellulomonas dongxiuzhuiae]MBO3089174.1 nucleotidyltransferase domain-containing protein [Cellulomonas dongxiuzhuiae]MBO3095047.1 nucleotidyltransferase domain-containing protein [Cellulomonas dongxiuzhuiae]QWC16061.1 nucleotidyltransferase domain-containing protein [Cellulomonas dongxiuzhuiae]
MSDPVEGVAADGTIRTGARRDRVPPDFEDVLRDAVASVGGSGASLYLYGSVATGTARPGSSDMDLLSIDLADAGTVAQRLSTRYADRCRGVEVAAAASGELAGDTDAAYGLQVFLRHYCVHLAGPDPAAALPRYPADARAARGLNGDLSHHLRRWRQSVSSGTEHADRLGVRVGRKTLLAVAGLVSVHDRTWTTDRSLAVRRWSEIEPELSGRLGSLHRWALEGQAPSRQEVEHALDSDGIVAAVVERFSSLIGLWPDGDAGT